MCLGYYTRKKLNSKNTGHQSARRALLSVLVSRVYVLVAGLSFCKLICGSAIKGTVI